MAAKKPMMPVLYFNESTMNSLHAFGIDLKSCEDLEEILDYAQLHEAHKLGACLFIKLKLGSMGMTTHGMDKEVKGSFDSELLDAGLLRDQYRLINRLNVIVTKSNRVIFYEGEESLFSKDENFHEKIIRAACEVHRVEDVMTTSIWETYCQQR